MRINYRLKMRGVKILSALVIIFLSGIMSSYAGGVTRTWDGDAGDSNWFNNVNWDLDTLPAGGDTVTVGNGDIVVLTNATPVLGSFTINNNSTLLFSDTTLLEAVLLATDVYVQNSGTVTHSQNSDTNSTGGWTIDGRVYIECMTCTVDADGQISVNGMGYGGAIGVTGYGPSGGIYVDGNYSSGAGHGGMGGSLNPAWPRQYGGTNYGLASAPVWPGSGGAGTTDNVGGGVVRINASGAVTVNGTVSADATHVYAPHGASAASGGSVYITCDTIAGSGMISANGGDTAGRAAQGGGGGGRIAVVYANEPAQSADVPIEFWTHGGWGGPVDGPLDVPNINAGEPGRVGSLYMSGGKFFPRITMVGAYNLIIPGFTSWSVSSLTITNKPVWVQSVARPANTAVRFPDGMQITVTGDLTIGAYGILELVNQASLDCQGDLIITDGGILKTYAGPTNGVNYGLLVNVGGELSLATNSYIFPYSDPTNGGSAKFVVGSMDVQPGGGITADGKGFGVPLFGVTGNGWGPGKGLGGSGNYGGGGGHGGAGGDASVTYTGGESYGSSNAPIHAGSSGGCAAYSRGKGGGVVWVEAPGGTIRVDGTISADGYRGYAHSGGGGAGGSIYLTAKSFAGVGSLGAIGGYATGGGVSGGGGGGRIALWGKASGWSGGPSLDLTAADYLTVTNGASQGVGATTGTVGTIVFFVPPPAGTVILIK